MLLIKRKISLILLEDATDRLEDTAYQQKLNILLILLKKNKVICLSLD